jgi:hypothetical protein
MFYWLDPLYVVFLAPALLCRLKAGGARVVNPEFESLLSACLEARQAQQAAGG